MKVIVSVPGKVHLMGEHAVVYGKPALLAAIDLRLTVSVETVVSRHPGRSLPRAATRGAGIQRAKDWIPGLARNDTQSQLVDNLVIESIEPDDYVRHIVGVVQDHFKLKEIPPLKITISSQIPAGYHLGSSAAVAVGTVGAFTYFLKKIWNPQLINQLAYEAEKKMHGNPSGGDNTTVTFGGFIWFRKELEFLKSIWQLPFKPHASLHHFFLINTGRPKETTGEMVTMVKERMKNEPEHLKTQLDLNEIQVKRVAVALKEGNEAELLDAIRVGERTLEGMGVVSDKVTLLIRKIEQAGGAAKILGGGGRAEGVGFLLCYHREPERIERLCQPYGFSIQDVKLGEEGVRLERGLQKV